MLNDFTELAHLPLFAWAYQKQLEKEPCQCWLYGESTPGVLCWRCSELYDLERSTVYEP